MIPRPLWLTSLVAIFFLACSISAQDSDLFSQSASAQLTRQFGGRNLSWVLLDRSGRILAQNWDDPDLPISAGSVLKPFIALAWGEQNGLHYPRILCKGTRNRCWLPRGHGIIGLESAIAESCNAYFLSLASELDRRSAAQIFARFGLHSPPPDATPETLIGLTDQWRETPLTLARAYLALANDIFGPAQKRILAGMRGAAAFGTARDVDLALGRNSALAKTGTAPCSHHARAAADGFTIVLFPALQPRLLLLVRMHAATGAHTATKAGAMLRAIGMGAP